MNSVELEKIQVMFLTHLRLERAILLTHKALYHLPHLFPISPVSPVCFSSTNSHSGIWLLPPTFKLSTSGPLHWRFPLSSLGSLNGRCLLSLNLTSSDYTFENKTYFLSMCPVYFLPVCLLPSCIFFSVHLPLQNVSSMRAGPLSLLLLPQ